MIRNRFPRFRNLQNLHVIPIASVLISNPVPAQSESPNITIIPQPLNTTKNIDILNTNTTKNIDILNTNTTKNIDILNTDTTKNIDILDTNIGQKMFGQNKPRGSRGFNRRSSRSFNRARKWRNRRKRQPKCFPLTPAEIDNSSYNWYDSSYLNQPVYSDPPPEKIEEIDESISEIPIEEDFEEVEVASVDGDGKQEILVGFRASKLQYLNYKKKCFFKPKFYKFGSQRTLVSLNVQDNSSVDIDIVSEAEYEIDETDNLEQSDSQDQQISKINKESLKSNEHSGSTEEEKPVERSKAIKINDVNESSRRIFKTCIEENADINQGRCLIQSSLDTWKSHLIGLEYLIEIQDKNKAKYYCVLCSEYLKVEEISSINVINHINGCKHVIGYLERHFPSYGFKFDENNVDTLRKICEEINEKMGYFSVCITNFDYFDKNEQKIKNIILNASHVNEESMKLEKCAYQKATDFDTLKDVQDVIEDIIEKLSTPEENTMVSEDVSVEDSPIELENEASHIASSELQSDSLKKGGKIYKRKESISKSNLKSPKSFLKYKGNSNLSSYLKVKYAKAKSKGLKPLKGLSNSNKKLSTEKREEKSSREKMHTDKTSSRTKHGEVVSDCKIHSGTSKKVLGDKEKVFQKPTVHSKHCRKRILGRETARLKVTAKESVKEVFISSTVKRSKEKCVPISELENKSSSKKIDQSLKSSETLATPSKNSSPVQKVVPVPIQKVSKQESKSSFTKHSKISHKDICKKGIESSKQEKDMVIKNSSNWKVMATSPVKSADNSHMSKRETRKHSGSPPIKRTVRRLSKSPLRLVGRNNTIKKFSRSPVRKHSRSPFRRNSRSPYKKLSKSPLRRKSRSPFWKHSRSPFRKKSRSPIRKRSRSPLGRHSRSPVRRLSRGSFRRHSRSPLRRYSRSPVRRRSRSPLRRRSRSPLRRRSRSPVRRRSRSPLRRRSRSPLRRRSRSPLRRSSRSPIKRLKSPIRKHSRGSVSVSQSPPKEFRSIFKAMSSNTGHSVSNQDHIISDKRFSQNVYKYGEHLGKHDRDFIEVRSSKNFHSPPNSAPDKHKSHIFSSSFLRGSDLDPVSDEDESIYFDKQRVEECISPSSKKMLGQFLQKFSVSNVNPDDPSLNKLMLFMEAHKAEIEELMGSQSTSKAGKNNANTVDPNLQERNLFLQQYLLSNLAGSDQETGLSSLNLNKKTKYQQPPFLPETDDVGCGIVRNVAPHNHPQSNLPRFFPPNVNVPPPDPYRPFNQPHQEFSPKPQVPQEVMFKDLKATVSKLFGANESATKLEKNKSRVPEYVTEPDPEKWDLSHPDTPKFNAPAKFSGHAGPRFNAPINQKSVFHSQANADNFGSTPESSVMRTDIPGTYNNNNTPGQFFSGRGIDRSQGLNVTVPPPDAKVSFCDVPRSSSKGNLFPVVHNVNSSFGSPSAHGGSISDVKVSLAQRLASVLVKIGMTDVPAPLLQEMLMKIGAFSSLPRQDISEAEIISILKRLGYLF